MKIKERYKLNKSSNTGDKCICPSCGNNFEKLSYQQAFCKTKSGTKCKDKYWNTVTPSKRNNKTRISPASARWSVNQEEHRDNNFNPNDEHPFSSSALGQWDD